LAREGSGESQHNLLEWNEFPRRRLPGSGPINKPISPINNIAFVGNPQFRSDPSFQRFSLARSASFEVALFRYREAMAASSRGRKPTGTRQKRNLSREAAAEISARPIAVAASRLATIFVSLSAGLRPQLVRLQVCFVRKVKVLFKETRSGL
jgi:hypothetical protein